MAHLLTPQYTQSSSVGGRWVREITMKKMIGFLWAAGFFLIAFTVALPALTPVLGIALVIGILVVVFALITGMWTRR